ncbi:hypothetical protein GCK72_020372 [Caenorhabditis remanei]|uniref:Uncharacterized protein n=1 Tax=Caenorhabditis remanei TaxID=31234 RepID=A0A6A5GGW9_CAERE|nr:hypothetical protein GCK72_020372 [Caenorhabditis remanei]KAF1753815.1 hypothetical protein GCK72_020372 [Caenorhabditis remanei]
MDEHSDDELNNMKLEGEKSVILKINETHEQIIQLLQEKPLETVRLVSRIVHLTLDNNLDIKVCRRSVRALAKHWKNSSYYKKRRFSLEMKFYMHLTTRIIFIRELIDIGEKSFYLNMLPQKLHFYSPNVVKFQKKEYNTAMGIGCNKNGRLGVGSTEEQVDIMTPVNLPNEINSVNFGANHTIIQLQNLELYGIGKMANFMEGMAGSDEICVTPMKLSFYKQDPAIKTRIIVKEDYTEINDYNMHSSLIIGNADTLRIEKENIRCSGPNWLIDNTRFRKYKNSEVIDSNEVEVDVYDGTKRTINILEDLHWIGKNRKEREMTIFMDGTHVDITKLKCFKWKGSKVFGMIDETIYSGKLLLVPREGEDDQFPDEDVVLMAVMDEVVCLWSFDTFEVSSDGESLIAWSNTPTKQPSPDINRLENFRPYESFESFNFREVKNIENFHGHNLLTTFNEICNSFSPRTLGTLYTIAGVPTVTCFIRGMLALIHFLRVDELTGLTEVFVKNVRSDSTLDEAAVKREFDMAMIVGSKIPVLVVKSEYTSVERENEMKKSSRDHIFDLMDKVKNLLIKFNSLPLKYRVNRLDTEFGKWIEKILRSCNEGSYEGQNFKNRLIPTDEKYQTNYCIAALKTRIESGDIDGGLERFKIVRVEAVAFVGRHEISPDNPSTGHHRVYWMHTTKFHIKCIDASLLEHIDEEKDVLNLSLRLVDSFFVVQNSPFHLSSFEREIDIASATASLPVNETYTVRTLDGIEMKVPKVLFEIFSEFDAARKRNSDVEDTFYLDYSADALKLFLACLLDVRVYYRASIELKMEVYKLAEFVLANHFRDELIRMILLKAEEKDHAHLGYLMLERPNEMISLIVRHRPDIVFFWKNLPVEQNHLEFIDKLANTIKSDRFNKVGYRMYREIDEPEEPKVEISQEFLLHYICNAKQDSDVIDDFKEEYPSRKKKLTRARKRAIGQ